MSRRNPTLRSTGKENRIQSENYSKSTRLRRRHQSLDERGKSDRAFANSYARKTKSIGEGASGCMTDAEWVDPDQTTASATDGSCDLTNNDWGYAVDPAAGTIDRGNACEGGTGIIPFLEEQGGPDRGAIKNITVPGNSGETELTITADLGDPTIPGSGESICFGDGCDAVRGSSNSSLDEDLYVNESGDEMTGSLNINKFELQNPDSNICIGAECDSPNNPQGPALEDGENYDAREDFRLNINTSIRSYQGSGTITIK